MRVVEVHYYKVWNDELKDWDKPPAKRSADAIAELKGEIIPETDQMVFKAMLDSEGRYFPPNYGENNFTAWPGLGDKGKGSK